MNEKIIVIPCNRKAVRPSGATVYCTVQMGGADAAVAASIVYVSLLSHIILCFLVIKYSLCGRLIVLNGKRKCLLKGGS